MAVTFFIFTVNNYSFIKSLVVPEADFQTIKKKRTLILHSDTVQRSHFKPHCCIMNCLTHYSIKTWVGKTCRKYMTQLSFGYFQIIYKSCYDAQQHYLVFLNFLCFCCFLWGPDGFPDGFPDLFCFCCLLICCNLCLFFSFSTSFSFLFLPAGLSLFVAEPFFCSFCLVGEDSKTKQSLHQIQWQFVTQTLPWKNKLIGHHI